MTRNLSKYVSVGLIGVGLGLMSGGILRTWTTQTLDPHIDAHREIRMVEYQLRDPRFDSYFDGLAHERERVLQHLASERRKIESSDSYISAMNEIDNGIIMTLFSLGPLLGGIGLGLNSIRNEYKEKTRVS